MTAVLDEPLPGSFLEPAAGWADHPACEGWWFLVPTPEEGGSGVLGPQPVRVYAVPGVNGQTIFKGVFRRGRDFVLYGMGRWYGPVVLPPDEG